MTEMDHRDQEHRECVAESEAPTGDDGAGGAHLPPVSLSALRATRSKLPIPGILYATDEGRVYANEDGISFTVARCKSPNAAAAIAAEHNAIDTLLECVDAMLHIEAVKCADEDDLEKWHRDVDDAERRYVAALSKVRP